MNKPQELQPWEVSRSFGIIKDRWIDLRADECITGAGVNISPYYVLSYPDWAHCVCFDEDDRICVVSQYRHGAAKVMMELPGGVVEIGETPLNAAKRELLEEAGVRAGQWRDHGNFSPNPATHTNRFHVFSCRLSSVQAPQPDPSEDIRVEFVTLPQLQAAISSGVFGQLLHIGALSRALERI